MLQALRPQEHDPWTPPKQTHTTKRNKWKKRVVMGDNGKNTAKHKQKAVHGSNGQFGLFSIAVRHVFTNRSN